MHAVNIYCRYKCSRTAFPGIPFEKYQQTFLQSISEGFFITCLDVLLYFLFICSNESIFTKNIGPVSRYIAVVLFCSLGPGITEFIQSLENALMIFRKRNLVREIAAQFFRGAHSRNCFENKPCAIQLP